MRECLRTPGQFLDLKKIYCCLGDLKATFLSPIEMGADYFIYIFSDFNQLRQLTGEWEFHFNWIEDAQFYFCL